MELMLKYSCNPDQKPSRIFRQDGGKPLVTVLSDRPGYINLLDTLNSQQLVKELKVATELPVAASFRYVNPAGATAGVPMPPELQKSYFVDDLEFSPPTCVYAGAREADRMFFYGDWIALSDGCDAQTTRLVSHEASDGVTAPGYSAEALEILKTKRRGFYGVVQIDPEYVPTLVEHKDVSGITFEQGRNNAMVDESLLTSFIADNRTFSTEAKCDLLVALITLKHIRPNFVCYAEDGQAIGVGAGQQSHIHCTRLTENKANLQHLRQYPQVLGLPFRADTRRPDRDNTIDMYPSGDTGEVLADSVWQQFLAEYPTPLNREERHRYLSGIIGVPPGSDVFFPFGGNVERTHRSGISFIVQPGGSIRDDHVIDTCNKYDIATVFTGLRLFHHQLPRCESMVRSEM